MYTNKLCPKCVIVKELSEFHFKKTEDRFNSWCKSCVYEKQKARWKDRKRLAVKLLGGKCIKCGYNKNLASLDFHHCDPNKKDYDWDRLRLRKWESIVKELEKCIVVCRNCHGEIHWPDQNIIFEDSGHSNPYLNRKIKSTGNCIVCNVEVYGTKYCSSACSHLGRRKVERPLKEELAKLLNELPVVKIAKQYGVSDNAVNKWAKYYGLK